MRVNKPELPKLLCMKGSNCYAMYTYQNAWDNEKKRSYRVSGSTKKVGVIVGGGKSGLIKWNDSFLDKYPDLEYFEARRDDYGHIFLNEKEDTEVTIPLSDALNAKRLNAGATWTFDNIIASTPLAKALSKVFSRFNNHKKILSLAYFLNICESNISSRYESFANTHRLPFQKPLTPSAITRLFKKITPDMIDKFIYTLNDLTMDRDKDDNSVKYWALDSTSISTYSKNLNKACFGHNKDGDELPQINVLMVVNQKTGEPVYYRTYSGNVPDSSSIKYFLQEHARVQLDKNAVIVADKGYSNITNIHRFYQNNVSFLLNLRTSFSICKTLFKEARAFIYEPVNYNNEIENFVYSSEIDWSFPVNFKHNCKRTPHNKEKMFVHMFYDKKIYISHEETLISNISAVLNAIKKNKTLTKALEAIKNTFLIEYEDNGEIKYKTNRVAFDDYLLMKGVRILVSNEVKDPIEAYKAYFDRNEVEYSFNLYKQRLAGSRMHNSSNEALEGKAFVQFIATSLAIMLRKRINAAINKNKELKLPYDSESVVISKLDSIVMTQFTLGSYYSEVVGNLRELMIAMDIPIPSEELGEIDLDDVLEENNEIDEIESEFESIEQLSAYQLLN